MTGSRLVDITPLPGGEWEKVYGFIGGELSIPKLGSVLVGFSQVFLENQPTCY